MAGRRRGANARPALFAEEHRLIIVGITRSANQRFLFWMSMRAVDPESIRREQSNPSFDFSFVRWINTEFIEFQATRFEIRFVRLPRIPWIFLGYSRHMGAPPTRSSRSAPASGSSMDRSGPREPRRIENPFEGARARFLLVYSRKRDCLLRQGGNEGTRGGQRRAGRRRKV